MKSEVPPLKGKDRLIVALDVPTVDEALRIVEQLNNVSFFKVGWQLFMTGGLSVWVPLAVFGPSFFIAIGALGWLVAGRALRRSEIPGAPLRAFDRLVPVLRLLDRAEPRAGGGVPEPAGDVAVDRLCHQPVPADPLEQHLAGHLALAETGDLDARREVGGRVLDRVVHVVRRHLDRQPDAVLGELLDLGLHPAIQADPFRARAGRPGRLRRSGVGNVGGKAADVRPEDRVASGVPGVA